MEAFKAANKDCHLIDFVRWHSPKDWVEDPEAPMGGYLSKRMAEPNNLWQQLWDAAKAVPISQQAPIFNQYEEANGIFQYIRDISLKSLLQQ
jgi:hypothetical protein